MEIKTKAMGKWQILDISGHIKGAEVSQFRATVQKALADGQLHLAANMKEVGFIDSSGVGATGRSDASARVWALRMRGKTCSGASNRS
jgi:anti-anti-sigma factor